MSWEEDPSAGRRSGRRTLAEQTELRARAAGITRDDPALTSIRDHNATVGQARCDWPTCPEHGQC
jgi:hypothetical protein